MTNQPTTHIATTPNKKPVTTLDQFRHQLVGDYQKQVLNYFSGQKEKAMKFMSAVVYSAQRNPALLECDRTTLLHAFMSAAEYQLYPSSVSGEAYVIPYKGKAQFQLGYQGIITLLYRAGVEAVNAQIICEKDIFEYEEGLEPKLVHKPNVLENRGKPIGVYAIAAVNGHKLFKVLSETDVMKFKGFSQSKNSEYTPWNSDNDPELWMWRKTAIKQLSKLLPKNETLQKAIEKDNEDSIIEARRANLDAGGPAVGRALHDPNTNTPNSEPENGQQ